MSSGGGGGGEKQKVTEEELTLKDVSLGQWGLREDYMSQIDEPFLAEADRDMSGVLRNRAAVDSAMANQNMGAVDPISLGQLKLNPNAPQGGTAFGQGLQDASNAARARTDQQRQHVVTTGARTGATAISNLSGSAESGADKQAQMAKARTVVNNSRNEMLGTLAAGFGDAAAMNMKYSQMEGVKGFNGKPISPWFGGGKVRS